MWASGPAFRFDFPTIDTVGAPSSPVYKGGYDAAEPVLPEVVTVGYRTKAYQVLRMNSMSCIVLEFSLTDRGRLDACFCRSTVLQGSDGGRQGPLQDRIGTKVAATTYRKRSSLRNNVLRSVTTDTAVLAFVQSGYGLSIAWAVMPSGLHPS